MWPLINSLRTLYHSPALLLALGSLMLLLTLNTVLLVWPVQTQMQHQWQQQGETLAAEYAHRATDLLTLEDRISLTVEVQRWARQNNITGVEVIDPHGRTITESGQVPGDSAGEFTAPLNYEDELLGMLNLWQDTSLLSQIRWRGVALLVTSTGLLAALAWWLWRLFVQRQQAAQRRLTEHLRTLFPALEVSVRQEPGRQAEALLTQLEQQYQNSLRVINDLQTRLDDHQLGDIHDSFRASEAAGEIVEGALLKIDLLNLDALEGQLTADTIKQLLDTTRQRCEDVMRLYHGETTQDPWLFLVRDHTDEGDFIQRTLCAAYVLNQLLQDSHDWTVRPRPEFCISIMAGPLYVGIQTGGGLPVLTVFGQTLAQLETLSAHNRAEQILIGEPVFQYAALGTVVEADIYRDITLPDSEPLEVWRLTGFAANWVKVLERQVEALRERF